jgi:hypothetical protein
MKKTEKQGSQHNTLDKVALSLLLATDAVYSVVVIGLDKCLHLKKLEPTACYSPHNTWSVTREVF